MDIFESTIAGFLNPQEPGALPLPGATVGAVGRAGTISYVRSLAGAPDGVAEPAAEDAIYSLASMTKFITTAAALQCVEKGLLNLGDDISTVLPEFASPKILVGFDDIDEPIFQPAKRVVTLRHLLTHSSGLAFGFESPLMKKYEELKGPKPIEPGPAGRAQTVEESFQSFLVYEPGENWKYSPAVDWAGVMIERVTGLKLGEFMQKNLFDPLGITDITFHLDQRPDLASRLAKCWFRNTSSRAIELKKDGWPPAPVTGDFGGGSLYASAGDLLKIFGAILQEDERILRKETIREIFTPQLNEQSASCMKHALESTDPGALAGVPRGSSMNWGLGGLLNLEDVAGRRRKGSICWSGFRNPYFWIDFQSGIAGVQLMHLLPTGDERTIDLLTKFEEAVYSTAGILS